MTGILCALPGIVKSAAAAVVTRPKTITAAGNAQVDTAQSKFGGASGLFDGTGDRLDITSASDLALGTGDFTIECWVRYSSVSGNQVIIDFRDTAANGAYILLGNNGGAVYLYVNTDYRIGNSGTQFSTNTWYHVAVARSGTSTKLFVDGTQIGSTYTDSNNYVGTAPDIGELNSSFNLTGFGHVGWIDEFRISKIARYTANFTAPTAAFVNDADTLLLIHADGTDASTVFTDDTGVRSPKGISAIGNAQVDTAQSKFGGASALFDGTGDSLDIASSSDFGFSTNDFTVECWVRFNSLSGTPTIWETRTAGAGTAGLSPYVSSSKFYIYTNTTGNNIISGSTTLSTNTWYHLAVSRSGNNLRMFLNGTQEGSTYTTSINLGSNNPFKVGQNVDNNASLNGWIDEVRISNTARYTAAFTAPTAAFVNDADTLLLIHADGTDASTTFTDDNS